MSRSAFHVKSPNSPDSKPGEGHSLRVQRAPLWLALSSGIVQQRPRSFFTSTVGVGLPCSGGPLPSPELFAMAFPIPSKGRTWKPGGCHPGQAPTCRGAHEGGCALAGGPSWPPSGLRPTAIHGDEQPAPRVTRGPLWPISSQDCPNRGLLALTDAEETQGQLVHRMDAEETRGQLAHRQGLNGQGEVSTVERRKQVREQQTGARFCPAVSKRLPRPPVWGP